MRSGAYILVLFIAITLFSSCRKKHFKCDQEVSFKNDIQPLLDARCNSCHAYDNYTLVQTSVLSGRLREVTINTAKMPPESEKRLTLKERKKIYCWLEAGAPDN